MSSAKQKINEAHAMFNRAFYGNGSIQDKVQAAYECSIAYDMANCPSAGIAFEQIGNYYWRIWKFGDNSLDKSSSVV